jgi:alpha-beta hydrolase superfamily lysophospholipase
VPGLQCDHDVLVPVPAQGLIKAELDSCDGGRPVYLMGESFGGLLVMALAIKLEAYIDR